MYIVITGKNTVDAAVYGPFEHYNEAVSFAESNIAIDWLIQILRNPKLYTTIRLGK
jgi:hypothetical protein